MDQIEVFKTLKGYENIDSNNYRLKIRYVKELEDTTPFWCKSSADRMIESIHDH